MSVREADKNDIDPELARALAAVEGFIRAQVAAGVDPMDLAGQLISAGAGMVAAARGGQVAAVTLRNVATRVLMVSDSAKAHSRC